MQKCDFKKYSTFFFFQVTLVSNSVCFLLSFTKGSKTGFTGKEMFKEKKKGKVYSRKAIGIQFQTVFVFCCHSFRKVKLVLQGKKNQRRKRNKNMCSQKVFDVFLKIFLQLLQFQKMFVFYCQSFKELKLVLQGKKTQREKERKNAF